MVEKLDGMPEGTFGFRISVRLTREEYFQLLDPVRDQLERRRWSEAVRRPEGP